MGIDATHASLSQLYEQLRSWVLDPSTEPWTGPRHLGFGVLLRRGMGAWIETCSPLTRVLEPAPPTPCPFPVPLPPPAHAQLAAVLASTLLSHGPGVTT